MASSVECELVEMTFNGNGDISAAKDVEKGVVNSAFTQSNSDQDSQKVIVVVSEGSNDKIESEGSASADQEEANCSAAAGCMMDRVSNWYKRNATSVKYAMKWTLLLLWIVYFIWTMIYNFKDGFDSSNEPAIRLISLNACAAFCVSYWAIKKYYGSQIWKGLQPFITKVSHFANNHRLMVGWVLPCFLIIAFAAVIIVDVALKDPSRLVSLVGMVVYISLFYVFSAHPSKVRWRPVILGLLLQFIFAYLILRTCIGYVTFKWLGDRIQEFLEHTDVSSKFVFGDSYTDHFLVFKVFPVVIFFNTIISVLYYLGVMQVIVEKIAWLMLVTMGTTTGESLNAATNIFLGQTETAMVIKPLLHGLTKSELHAVMTGGFATLAGTVMAIFMMFGVPANHLMSASVMSAPAALAMSKLFYPETQKTQVAIEDIEELAKPQESSIVEAASSGAMAAVKLIANILANIIACLAILEFFNQTLTWFGAAAGLKPPNYPELTFELICSYLMYPFAFIMGTPIADCKKVATLIGVKLFTNEVFAFSTLGALRKNRLFLESWENPALNQTLKYDIADECYILMSNSYSGKCLPAMSERAETVAIYAIGGFCNVGSTAIMLGVLGAMLPNRKKDLASTVFRAMIAGNVACHMTACIAGLISGPEAMNPETCQLYIT
ncbi:solute carrier family 28 member 3-like [Watersipora subatra]|uniref:solute carrier family 28 member 3-like n=1 Tax=Watersipora subatra TaxID=2589382 RepID=UPI00355C150F